MARNAPTGVKAISVLYWALCAACVLGALLLLIVQQGIAALMVAVLGPSFSQTSVYVGIVLLIFAGLYGALAWGLWRTQQWARVITIILAAVLALGELVGIIIGMWLDIVGLVVNALIFAYLLRPRIGRAFA